MWRTHLVGTLRALRKQRLFGFINVFGLAVGLACAFLITLYVRHELSYDRHYAYADRLYRITTELQLAGDYTHYARASAVVGQAIQEADPNVEATARLWPSDPVVGVGAERFFEERFYYADPSVFRVFSVPFVTGDPARALTAPGQVVLTAGAARRYFGEADALGQTVRVGADGEPFEVVGVVADVPEASHVHYDVLASMGSFLPEEPMGPGAWVSQINYLSYVLLRPGARPEAAEARAEALVEQTLGDLERQFNAEYTLHLQPVTEIHLHSDLTAEAEPGG
ncbi:MAG TPA: ABC transporter permease, partial [Rhodothermales bacterium]|nr:ABC transporter permease [Rhodothermales bacterium]